MDSFMFAEAMHDVMTGNLRWEEEHSYAQAWLIDQHLQYNDWFYTPLWKIDYQSMASAPPMPITNRVTIYNPATNTTSLDAADVVWGPQCTFSAQGVIVTVNSQPICYDWLGGKNTICDGTFTVIWDPKGVCTTWGELPEAVYPSEADVAMAVLDVAQWLTVAASE